MTDFVTVTAMRLLDDTEPGRIIFPISYWTVVPGRFELGTHAQLVAVGQREAGGLWRLPVLNLPVAQSSYTDTCWAAQEVGRKHGVQRLMWQKSMQKHPHWLRRARTMDKQPRGWRRMAPLSLLLFSL